MQLGNDGRSTRETAFHAILSQWSVKYQAETNQDPCRLAARHGLECLKGKESFEVLRRLNRPAVLRMRDESGSDYYAALTGISGDNAILAVGNRAVFVKIADMGRQWSGEYELLWRLPPGYSTSLRTGHSRQMVSWLNRQLAAAEGRSASGDERVYSLALLDRLKLFQGGSGLVSDGMVGPKTAICLSDVTHNNDPHLVDQGGR